MVDNKTSTDKLRQELEQAIRFLHTLGMQSKLDLIGTTSRVLALIEELVGSGVLDLRAFDERRETITERETARMEKEGHVQVFVDNTPDKYALAEFPVYDCLELIPICKGRCCQLSFPLSFQDLDEGALLWNYGAPYQIKKCEDGFCVHSDPETRTCSVYDKRPAVCRIYDCRKDERIWKDFEKKIPADWNQLEPNLAATKNSKAE